MLVRIANSKRWVFTAPGAYGGVSGKSGLSSCHDPTLLYRDTPGWRGPPVLALLGLRMFLVGKGWDHATALGLGVSMLG
ncbi:Uncharacterized protein HZ326_15087 [Fusarium oxysporum f. sp. albedinis]|nr:Uncharacterized protein HZ326_15087 [Fusarium oxysporum f. sp. albedinis]